jgi:hypothetical protein
MRSALLSTMAAVAFISLASGCGTSTSVVRGKTADDSARVVARANDAGFDCQCPPDCECKGGTRACRHGNGCKLCRPYHIPTDLVFPPPCDMPAIVQYPYYTTKGPDDFFMQ